MIPHIGIVRLRMPEIYGSPQVPVVQELCEYRMKLTQTVGTFLGEYHQKWEAAQEHGVTKRDGIYQLTNIIQDEWKGWVSNLAPSYVHTTPDGDENDDYRGFITHISSQFYLYGVPPATRNSQEEDHLGVQSPSVHEDQQSTSPEFLPHRHESDSTTLAFNSEGNTCTIRLMRF